MAAFFLTFLIFIGVTAVTAVLFGGWLLVTAFRLAGRAAAFALGIRPSPKRITGGNRCPYVRCRQDNPPAARYAGAAASPYRRRRRIRSQCAYGRKAAIKGMKTGRL